ncbi:hypothetical protein DIS24_g8124 [Lasiodiplodia hormozganensis]|uniref:Uncharacterized protein n=1 Tax=Lasiodiplodia hormozganensis TaxID=869390 RepID=A0AA39Y4C0_9PEZI|nr:hypothetical protein DIS24_g8124 [Lasiodiplodia hormozganensis]
MLDALSENQFLLTSDSDMDPEEQLESQSRLAAARSCRASNIRTRTVRLFKEEVNLKFVYIPLLACCFCAGLTDSTMYSGTFPLANRIRLYIPDHFREHSIWHIRLDADWCVPTLASPPRPRAHPSTGNTIFVALSASGQGDTPYGWAWSLCSMTSFVVGCFFFARFHAALGARRRATLVLSFLLQGCCACIAAGLIQGGVVDGRHSSSSSVQQSQSAAAADIVVAWAELAPVALLSFQSAGQIVASRMLSVAEVPTVVITSLLCDLVSDPAVFASPGGNGKRNRRIAAFVLIFVGAIAGGWIIEAAGAVQWALWIVAGIKLFMSCCWLNWKASVTVGSFY